MNKPLLPFPTRFLAILLIWLLPCASHAQGAKAPKPLDLQGADVDKVKDLGKEAIAELIRGFVSSKAGQDVSSYALPPLKRDVDDGYFSSYLESQFAAQGRARNYQLYTRENAGLSAILNEIQWGEDYEDVMDPATVQKFGKIAGVQAILLCRVDVSRKDNEELIVRASLKAVEVGTGRILSGANPEAVKRLEGRMDSATMIKLALAVLVGLILLWLIFKFIRAFILAGRPR